ncbi:DNA processing protein DprA [Candidatus Woesearchaeota archaeon]|nr:DNA processing protein DprA [Candidatus Woesearchaeota archaeon]
MARDECFYHAALVINKSIKQGSKTEDQKARVLLKKYGSFEEIFRSFSLDKKDFSKIKKAIDKVPFDFSITTVNDPDYPLKDIQYASPALYTRGNKDLLKNSSIAVVGTRKLKYQQDIDDGNSVMKRLLAKDYTIVSGLAFGCDALAHKYAVNNNGKTIAVLGTPLKKPSGNNKDLEEMIGEKHLVVSQYPTGSATYPSYFAHRNITTVGLSKEGIVVMLSPDKSGTQHAIRECIKQEKQLYILDSNLDRGFRWTDKLEDSYKVVYRR